MHCSVQVRDQTFVKSYQFFFSENVGKNIGKNVSKNLSHIYIVEEVLIMLNNLLQMHLQLL